MLPEQNKEEERGREGGREMGKEGKKGRVTETMKQEHNLTNIRN